MKFIAPLTDGDKDALVQLQNLRSTARQRRRAQAVLLSAKGYTLIQIADILDAGSQTVSGWLSAWQEQGLAGLADAPKPGCPRKMEAAVEAELLALLENPTPDLKVLVQAHLKKKLSLSPGTP